MAAVVPAQQVLQAAFGENPQNLQVLHFDPSRGETALCRIFLRRGACKWGDLCRHSHEMDLSSYSLRARRGAAMPALVQGDPKAALETASENIAFVLSGPKAVYDFEDPHVARSFLAPAASDLWAWLPWELAVDTLWSAGPRGAVSACMACKDWGPKQVAQGLRERFYREVTGADFSGCTWRHLCDFMLTRRLLHSARGAQGERRALVDQGCGPVVHICQPSPVFLLFLDGAVTFALLRSGEVRCHRSSTGQILGQSTRLGKGRQLQAAALLGCEAFVLGDDQGGLVLLLRDDLSESQQLRSQGPPGGVASMAALQENQQACVAVNMDGSIELIQVNLEDDIPAARIHPVCRMDSLQMIPAIRTYNFADTDFALVTAGPRRVWSITLDADQQCQSLMSEGTEPPMPDAPGLQVCHVCAVGNGFVTASTGSPQLQWFSREINGEILAEAAMVSSSGVVLDLSACGDLCAALHSLMTVTLWQGTLRLEVLRISMNGIGHSVSLGLDTLAIASAPMPPGGSRGRGSMGTGNSLHLATLPLFVEKLGANKESKMRNKPAKIFAQKSRGGRKNQKGKQSRQQ